MKYEGLRLFVKSLTFGWSASCNSFDIMKFETKGLVFLKIAFKIAF